MMIAIIILSTAVNMLRPYITGTILYDEVLSKAKNSQILKAIPINDFSLLFGIKSQIRQTL